MNDLPTNYTVNEMKGEEVFENDTGRWQYVSIRSNGQVITHRYFHVDCDCITDGSGHCIICGAKAWTH